MTAGKKITIRTIAELCGVSVSTVSLAINNKPGVRAEVRELVQKTVAELGWCSNGILKNLPAAPEPEVVKIAYIVCEFDDSDSGNARMFAGVERASRNAGCDLSFFNLDRNLGQIGKVIETLKVRRIDKAVFRPLVMPDYEQANGAVLACLEAAGIEFAVIDTLIWEKVLHGNFVGADGYRGVRNLVAELIRRGFRRFGSLRAFPGVYTSEQRHAGIADELQLHGLSMLEEDQPVISEVPVPEQGREQIRRMLASPKGLPEVLLCTNDVIAYNVFDELCRHGVRIPEDISLAGFDDLSGSGALGLTSIRQPFERIGKRAVELLLDDSDSFRQEFIPCEFILRRSCGAPAR